MRRLLAVLALFLLAAVPLCAQTITITGGTFSGTTEPFQASDTPNTLTLTNSTGGDIVLIVDRTGGSAYSGMNGVLEVNNSVFPRNHNLSSCFPYAEESVVILSGGTCQFLAYLKPIASGAVSGDIRVEYVPKTTNQLVSVTLSNGNTRRNIVTSAPVANLQVGYYVTIWGTGADPNSSQAAFPISYSNTQKVTAITDSQHFQTENTSGQGLATNLTSPMPNPTNGYISDATINKWATLVTVTGAITGTGAAQPAFDSAHPPALPAGINADYTGTVMDTTYTAPGACTGATITTATELTNRLKLPAQGGTLACGDVLCVQANTTYSGLFTLPNIPACTSYTYLISADYLNAAFPPAGTRVAPADQAHLFTLSSNAQGHPTLEAALGAGYWRVVGAEMTRPTNGVAGGWGPGFYMVPVNTPPTQASDLNHHIILDRSWIHRQDADSFDTTTAGVEVDGNNLAVIDSRIENVGNQEIQAIANCNGNGPIKIVNNYLEATGENVIFGGCDPTVQGTYPKDIEIRNNYFTKRLSWLPLYASSAVKNILEFKSASRALVTGNIFKYNWADDQDGSALVINPFNQHGGAPSGRVTDITYVQNLLSHTNDAWNFSTGGFSWATGATRRVLIKDMLLQDIGTPVVSSGLTLTVDATAKTFTRSTGSWTTDGLVAGNSITFSGLVNANNNLLFDILSITGGGTVITVTPGSRANGMVSEGPTSGASSASNKWVTGGWGCTVGSNTVPSGDCAWTMSNLMGTSGVLYSPAMPARDFQLDHVTGFASHGVVTMDGAASSIQNVLVTNSILWESSGITGNGQTPGANAIAFYMASPTFNTNVFLENSTWSYGYPNPFHYPVQNAPTTTGFWFEDSTTIASNANLFTDYANCNGGTFDPSACVLKAGSYYLAGGARQASDGLAVGANISAIVARTACVTTGAGCGLADAPSVLPASINFGDQAIGSSSPPSTVTFTNATGSSITITSANLTSGANYSRTNNCGTLAANASCTVTVVFSPQAPAGTETDTLTFISSDAFSPHTIALTGNATGTPPNAPVVTTFSANPASFLQFSNTFTFTLTTTGADIGCEEYIQSKGITIDVGAVSCNGTFTFTPPGPFSLDYTSPYSVWVVANGSGGNTQSSTLSVYVQKRVAAAGVPF